MAHQKFEKELTESDLDMLVLPKEMCVIMTSEMGELIRSHARGERIPPIGVSALDNKGVVHEFHLTGRTTSKNLKPTLMAKGWRKSIRGARAGDIIYFWAEVNEMMGRDYRIALVTSYLRPHPENLSSVMSPAPEDLETKDELMSRGATGGLALSS